MSDAGVPKDIQLGQGVMYDLPVELRAGSFFVSNKERRLNNLKTLYNVAIDVADRELTQRLPLFGGTTKTTLIKEDTDWGLTKACLDGVDKGKETLNEALETARMEERDDVTRNEKALRMLRGYVIGQIAAGAVSGGVGFLLDDVTKALEIPPDSQVEFLSAVRATGVYLDVGGSRDDSISFIMNSKGYVWNQEVTKYERKQA